MFELNIKNILSALYLKILGSIEFYLPKIIGALIIIGIGILISLAIYKIVIYLFFKFKIINLIDKLNIDIEEDKKTTEDSDKTKKIINVQKISDKIKIDIIIAKAFSYYIFLVFFRLAIVFIGIKEIEKFLGDLIAYLPSLFIAVIIGFFGIRFADFIHDLVFHAIKLTKQKTAKIIASGAKIIILFFTLMVVLSKIGIATEITNTILIGFVSMLAIAGGLAFGLGGKDIAAEILESFRK